MIIRKRESFIIYVKLEKGLNQTVLAEVTKKVMEELAQSHNPPDAIIESVDFADPNCIEADIISTYKDYHPFQVTIIKRMKRF